MFDIQYLVVICFQISIFELQKTAKKHEKG